MSNRVCLFSTNFIPGTDVDKRRVVGLSEWGNDLPLGFKILVSANPNRCSSLIFEDSKSGAVIGDFEAGVARFLEFLARVPHPAVPALADEARNFLSAPQNKNRYILLEPEEYFWLGNDEPVKQMDHLLADLANLQPSIEKAIDELKVRMHEEATGARPLIRRGNSNDMVFALGLGGWDNTLYYEPT